MRWRWDNWALCLSKLLDVDPAELSCVVPGSPELHGSILRSAHPTPLSNAIRSPQNPRCCESDYLSVGQAVLRLARIPAFSADSGPACCPDATGHPIGLPPEVGAGQSRGSTALAKCENGSEGLNPA